MEHSHCSENANADSLQAAIDDLQMHGFARYELSILADENAVTEKLGHIYKRVEEVEDDPKVPRTIFVPKETIAEAEGALFSTPLYIAAVTATAVVVTSGGTLATAIGAAMTGGLGGAALGMLLAALFDNYHTDYIQNQIEHGGLLLWVHLRSPDLENKAKEMLLFDL